MECPICFNHINKSYSTDCMHHFCQTCIVKWCKNNAICPKCRSFILFLKPDPEFDSCNNNNNHYNTDLYSEISTLNIFSTEISIDNISLYYIDFKNKFNKKVGITLTDNNGVGVKIYKLDSRGIAQKAGLKCNQIILFINNIPCFNHKQAISLIKINSFLQINIIFKVLKI